MVAVIISIIIFVAYTVAVKMIDVAAIGPNGSEVGFAALNGWFHDLTGVDMNLYNITDVVELIPLLLVAVFGVLGLTQWVRRKKLMKVDAEILALGVFYLCVLAAFVLFEVVKINYRPVLIDGVLETSYPSSTTMLAVTVCATAAMVAPKYLKGRWGKAAVAAMGVMLGFLVIGRLLSGVHWLTDIVGGVLLSGALITVFLVVRKGLKKLR